MGKHSSKKNRGDSSRLHDHGGWKRAMISTTGSSFQQQNQQDNMETFGSRKRTLEKINFVFPKEKDGTNKPYNFGSDRSEREVEMNASGQIEKHSEDNPSSPSKIKRSNETLEEILNIKKSSTQSHQRQEEDKDMDITSHTRTEQESQQSYPIDPTADADTGHLSGMSVEEVVRDRVGCRPRANSTDGELKLPRRGLCDERTVLKNYQWNSDTIEMNSKPKGFHNLGNTVS